MIKKGAAGLILLVAAYFLAFGGEYGFVELWRMEQEYEAEVAELEAIRVEVAELEAAADSLATDSAAWRPTARPARTVRSPKETAARTRTRTVNPGPCLLP